MSIPLDHYCHGRRFRSDIPVLQIVTFPKCDSRLKHAGITAHACEEMPVELLMQVNPIGKITKVLKSPPHPSKLIYTIEYNCLDNIGH